MHIFFRFETQTKFIIRTVRTFFFRRRKSQIALLSQNIGRQNKSAEVRAPNFKKRAILFEKTAEENTPT